MRSRTADGAFLLDNLHVASERDVHELIFDEKKIINEVMTNFCKAIIKDNTFKLILFTGLKSGKSSFAGVLSA